MYAPTEAYVVIQIPVPGTLSGLFKTPEIVGIFTDEKEALRVSQQSYYRKVDTYEIGKIYADIATV
jgi:hypothetical protein